MRVRVARFAGFARFASHAAVGAVDTAPAGRVVGVVPTTTTTTTTLARPGSERGSVVVIVKVGPVVAVFGVLVASEAATAGGGPAGFAVGGLDWGVLGCGWCVGCGSRSGRWVDGLRCAICAFAGGCS